MDYKDAMGDQDAALAGFSANWSLYNDSDLVTNATFANDTRLAVGLNSFYFFQTAQIAVLWAMFVLIVLGNLSVLLALAFNKRRKSRMNFFIMQLAIADLAVGLISVPTDLVWRMTVDWHAGNLACKLIRYLQVMVTYSSTYVLVALSIDRYDAITHPMNFSRSGRRSRCLVVGAWALSCVFAAPILVLFEEKEVQGRRQCWIELTERWQWRLYVSLVALVLFALPALIISFCYAVIVCTIWNKSHGMAGPRKGEQGGLQRALLPGASLPKSARATPHPWGSWGSWGPWSSQDEGCRRHAFPAGPAGPAGPKEEPECRRASSRGLIPRAKVKTVKMTLVIVFVFVLCWSPYFVINLLQVYDHFPTTQTNIAVSSFVQSLAPLNSAANPLIYCLFSTHICRTLRKVPPFTWVAGVLALRDSPAAATDNNNSTETVTNLGTSPCRRHHVTVRVPKAAAGVAISAV